MKGSVLFTFGILLLSLAAEVSVANPYYIRVIVLDRESEVPILDANVRLDYYPRYSSQTIQRTDNQGIADLIAGSDEDDSYHNTSDCTERYPHWAEKYWACEIIDRKDIHITHPDYKVIKGRLSWKALFMEDDDFFSTRGLDISHGGWDVYTAYPPITDEYEDSVEKGDYCEVIAYMTPIASRR